MTTSLRPRLSPGKLAGTRPAPIFTTAVVGPASRRWIRTVAVALVLTTIYSTRAEAQTPQPMPPGPLNPERPSLGPVDQSDENFTFLRNPAERTDFWDPFKYIALDPSGNSYLTVWFENRSEFEWFQDEMWGQGSRP
jgi:hypothetical protein